jgi:hypothetical protein
MKTKILSGLICCLGIFSANAQTITAPTGQNLTITNAIDVTGAGNSMNIPVDAPYKIGGLNALSAKGTLNIFAGAASGQSITTGSENVFVGILSGQANTTASSNVFVGSRSGFSNVGGSENLFLGAYSGYSNTSGRFNFFGGSSASYSNTTGEYNLSIGHLAGFSATTGSRNLIMGGYAGYNNNADNNSFIGINAGFANTIGNQNVFIGSSSGNNNVSGSNNTCIGFNSNLSGGSFSNSTAIGANTAVSASNTIVLGNAATTITGQGLAAGVSGLRFANLNSSSGTTSVPGGKVLGVDGAGNVVLVQISGATTSSTGTTAPVADATWKNQDGYLYNNSTNGVVINGSGLEGNALIVKGGVLSKEMNVKVEGSESWPDYVFKPSYKRMSLDEVEKFININGHLPNVPSATEMVANGNNLGKTDVKLLEKVEELTLYLLEMKKASEAQNAEIQNLKKQVKSLRKK